MPAYNFLKQFASLVETGAKRTTIRGRRKHPAKRGDILYLYTGQRQKTCRKLREAICLGVKPLKIMKACEDDAEWSFFVNDRKLSKNEVRVMAWTDARMGVPEFLAFFKERYGLPVEDLEILYW